MARQDNSRNNMDNEQKNEDREKILIPVRRHKHADEDEISAENDKHRRFVIPRRWHIY